MRKQKQILFVSAFITTLLLTGCQGIQSKVLGYTVDDFKYILTDFDKSYTPNEGEVNVLIVPISLGTAKDAKNYSYTNWNSGLLDFVNKCYFLEKSEGNYGNFTFKEYYETASYGKITIDGAVAPIYNVPSDFSIKEVNEDETNETLYELLDDALKEIQANDKETDWDRFDYNHDGYFDAVHFITDFYGAEWSDVLWPHMWYANREVNDEYLTVDVYSLSSTEHFTNARTAIHEQGHMFGLQDYYDYSYEKDYILSADMQVYNVFDWNSYSKSTVGWSKPYIVNGEKDVTKITMNAASMDGSCLIVPANYETYNGTPFDEYFMFELFSKENSINASEWITYENAFHQSLGEYGVRAYHVNGLLYNKDDNSIIEEPTNGEIDVSNACNNSYNYADYDDGLEEYKDYPLLTIISADNPKKSTSSNSSYLNSSDLWKEGSTFHFSDARYSLLKSGQAMNTMVNGETFPYEIHFDKMSSTSMTVTITKVSE